jgi:hypothetical protein
MSYDSIIVRGTAGAKDSSCVVALLSEAVDGEEMECDGYIERFAVHLLVYNG